MSAPIFVHKLSASGHLQEGCLYSVPRFCISHHNEKKCKSFYKDLIQKDGICQCPYGFGAEYLLVEGRPIILTCLNVETKTIKKEVLKRLSNNEYSPRLPIHTYENLKEQTIVYVKEDADAIEKTSQRELFDEKTEIVNNTIHDLRKLSNQLQHTSAKIIEELDHLEISFDLNTLCTNLYAITNLISIHLNCFDLESNPDLSLSLEKREIPIYKKIEKVYKCLKSRADEKGIHITLDGQSYGLYNASPIVEIGFFILIDNAIKYSYPQSEILISFHETGNQLSVTIKNWGIKPMDGELKHFFERGFRGKNYESSDIEGRGIGLYLLSEICDANEIKYKVSIAPNATHAYDGWVYVPYMFDLTFHNITQPKIRGDKQ